MMNRTRLLSILLLLGSYGAGQSATGGAAEIEQLQVKREGADVRIEVILTGVVKPSVETAINPDRLVLTLPGTLSDPKQKRFPLNANGVRGVRVGLNNANPPVTRVVVDMDSAHPYTVSSEGRSIILLVQPVQAAQAARHDGPAPAASAPLVDVFRHKPQASAVPDTGSTQAPMPVPPKLPPLNFPESQSTSTQPVATASNAKPSAAHPKLGSLEQGTVFPGMGTPGTGAVPATSNTASDRAANSSTTAAAAAATPAQGTSTPPFESTPAATTSSTNQAASGVTVSTTAEASHPAGVKVSIADAGGRAAPSPTAAPGGATTGVAAAATGPATVAAQNLNAGAGSSSSSSTKASPAASSPGAPNVTTTVATVAAQPSSAPATAAAPTAAPQGATVANPLGLPSATPASPPAVAATTATATATSASGPQGATVANPLGLPQASAPASGSATPAASSSPASSATVSAAPAAQPSTFQGATVSNPLGLPPGTTAPLATSAELVNEVASVSPGATVTSPTGTVSEVVSTIPAEVSATEQNIDPKSGGTVTAANVTELPLPAEFALRASHPDFRTSFHVKYVASGSAYLDGGRAAGLAEGMKLVVRETPTSSVTGAASGNPDSIVAELEVLSVAESSAVADIHTPKRDIKPGDLAYLSAQDEQSLVRQSTLSATRKYPAVVSFTEEDTLDDEARAEIPKPPMPSVNRARGRFGFSYMGMNSPGTNSSSSTSIGLVARMDMTRIGGTYWNLNGYWTGRLTTNSYSGTQTLQNLLNRTYHLAMTYDNPHSAWVAGFGRMFLPWATSLDTIDGGYVGRRLGHGTTLGIFAGSTPDPTSYSYNPDRRIGGTFVNFQGGDFNAFHYTSTSGIALSTLQWKIDRPFIFFENGLSWKRYVSIYDALQADRPAGNQAVTAPGAGIGRNFLTVRVMPVSRLEFDANYNYFRDLPTFDPTLIGTGLLDKYLFQGFSAGVRLEALKQVWLYTQFGQSNRSGDARNSLNELYGITFGRLPWIHIGADAHYSRFNSTFGSGYYESVSINRRLSDVFQLEVLAGRQNFSSQYSSNNFARFVNGLLEMNLGPHYFLQGGFTASRGASLDYNQWLFTFGYRFDTRQRIKDQ
jgi:hypothetical protein